MSTKLNPFVALRFKKSELGRQCRELLALAAGQNRDLTTAEAQQFDRHTAMMSDVESKLVEAEAALEAERTTRPVAVIPGNGNGQWRAVGDESFKPGARPKRYAELFGPPAPSAFSSFGEFLRSVHYSSRTFDQRLSASTSQTENVPSDGGFAVPTEFSQQILDQALESEIVRPRATVWAMTSDTRRVPALQDSDHSNSTLFGGVTASWKPELASIDQMNVKLRMIELSVDKLAMLAQASSELLEDTSFESILGAKLVAGASWHLDNAFLFGDGSSKPLGCLNAGNPALVTVSKESSQPTDAVAYENIVKMYAAMSPRNRRNAVWVFNDGLIPSLYSIQNRVFNLAGSEVVGGNGTPVFSMNPDGTGTLLTRPVLFSEKMSAPGDLGDAAFIDFSAYAIGVRREIVLAKSTEAGFVTDSAWFRLTCRIDGQPTWNAPLKPLHGTSQSPFVVLQAR